MADRLEHRQVRDGIRVRIGTGEVEAGAIRELAHRAGLLHAVGIELEQARVPAVVPDRRARRDHSRDPEVSGQRSNDLLGG